MSDFVVLRLSPCSECSLYSSGNFPGVLSLKADVSGLNVGPIVLGDQEILLVFLILSVSNKRIFLVVSSPQR